MNREPPEATPGVFIWRKAPGAGMLRDRDNKGARVRHPGGKERVSLSGWLLCATMEDADLVATLIDEHRRLSRAEPGCLSFDVVRSMSDPMRFAVREVFADRTAFEAHQERTRASDWWRRTGHIERDYRIETETDQDED